MRPAIGSLIWCLLLLVLSPFCLVPVPAGAQLATRIEDLDPISETDTYSPHGLTELNGKTVFLGSIGDLRDELWITDGTAAGTELLVETCPQECSGTPSLLGKGGGLLYFSASNPDSPFRSSLWRTDGTPSGTFAVTPDSLSFFGGSSAAVSPTVGRKLLFTAYSPERGEEPWVSDGTVQGTHLLLDLLPGAQSSSPAQYSRVGNRFMFFAQHQSGQRFLWRSDGSAAGTEPVAPVQQLGTSRTVAGGRLFVLALSGSVTQLWVSDGTLAGTVQLTQSPSGLNTESQWLKQVGDRVYFTASSPEDGLEVWVSDGTQGGTRPVTRFETSNPFHFGGSLLPDQLAVAGGNVFVVARDGEVNPGLYVSNGNPASTRRLADVNACDDGFCFDNLPGLLLVPIGNRVVTLVASEFDYEMRSFDGSPGGSIVLHEQPLADFAVTWGAFAERPGEMFFLAQGEAGRIELLRSDGTASGTSLVAILPAAFDTFNLGSMSTWLLPIDSGFSFIAEDELYAIRAGSTQVQHIESPWRLGDGFSRGTFSGVAFQERLAWDPHVREFPGLRLTSGTAATSEPFVVANAACPDRELALLGSNGQHLYVSCADAFRTGAIWATDGTDAGTVLVFPPPDSSGNRIDSVFTLGANLAYFTANHDDFVVWRSDGTVAGTFGVMPDLPGRDTYAMHSTHVSGDRLFWLGAMDGDRIQLWTSDGTAAGTHRLTSLSQGFDPSFENSWVSIGGVTYLTARDEQTSIREVWRSDGTVAGTAPLFDCAQSGLGCEAFELAALGDELVYFSRGGNSGEDEIWVSDGTAAGTRRIGQEIDRRFGFGSSPRSVVAAGLLYFTFATAGADIELWSSDGTAAGTGRVEDIFPGVLGSRPQYLTSDGTKLYFSAHAPGRGVELWTSDGTAEGTRLVHDISPGPRSSNPEGLTVAGSRLYFWADDGTVGRELWSLDLTADAEVCAPGEFGLCVQDDRFRVEIDWRDFQGRTGRGTPVPLSADTGYFWFFNPANVETIVKVLDGRGVNGHFWTFYGALSNVEYTMTVADAQSGLTQRYFNPARQFASVGDTESFGPNGAALARYLAPRETLRMQHAAEINELFDPSKGSGCAPSSRRLCLADGRFAVEATWRDFQGRTGAGEAVELTADTGTFWFFDAANVEVVTKVLDGRPVNGKFWVFYGALSNVEYTLTVTDTHTGAIKTYFNPSRRFGSVGDTGAF